MTDEHDFNAVRARRAMRRKALHDARAALTPPAGDPTAFDEDSTLCLDALRRAHAIIEAAIKEGV